MTAAWMLYSMVVGMLVAAAAAAVERVCGSLGKPVRFVWCAALLATLFLSGFALARAGARASAGEGLTAEQLANASSSSAGVPSTQPGWLATLRASLSVAEARLYGTVARATGEGRVLMAAWLLGSATLAALFATALVRYRRARRQWQRRRVAGVYVLVAQNSGPALVGLWRPEIVIPAWLLNAPAEDRRVIVQHEQEHRAAGDPLLLAAACAVLCLLPWNPALWWMLRRTRLAVELDCDARVLEHGVEPGDYGELLLNVASRGVGLPLAAPALTDSRSHLERRIIAMTASPRSNGHRRAMTAGISAALLATAACSADMPTAAEIDRLDVATAEKEAKATGFIRASATGDEPLFIVDGVIQPAGVARMVAPEQIESIEVTKGGAATAQYGERAGNGVVHVRTKAAAGSTADEAAGTRADDAVSGRVIVRENGRGTARGRVQIRPAEGGASAPQPLFIVDGVVTPPDFDVGSIDPNTIERIEVIKGPAALRTYGERGANGVILLTLKS